MTLSVSDDGDAVAVCHAGETLLRYRAETAASKPHVDRLALPADAGEAGGRNLALAAPHDHVWHLGLFFVQKVVDGVNCWESELGAREGTLHGFATGEGHEVRASGDRVAVTQSVTWRTDAGETLLDDERTVTVRSPGDRGYVLDWEQTLTAREGRRHLASKTRHGHYSGLSLRFGRELDGGHVRVPGETDPPDEAGAEGAWCDYSGRLDGFPGPDPAPAAGVTLFDHPDNDPSSTWFTMREPFGFVAANPTWGTVRTLDRGESLTWRWGAWVHAGTPDPGDCEAARERWLS